MSNEITPTEKTDSNYEVTRRYEPIKLNFTDSEWMSIIDGDRDGLPICCANISALRDCIISAARNGGEIHMFEVEQMRVKLGWCMDGHDMSGLPLIQRISDICTQAGKPPLHVPQRDEII